MWADVANPWTHVAAERLRVALAGTGVAAEIVWRPLLTEPADPDAARDALRLLVLAEEHGGAALQGRVAAELLASHDVRDRAELAAVAERAGFPGGGAALASDAGRARLRELLLIGKARGITISPTLAVRGELLEFAMSPATIGEFLREAGDADGSGDPDGSSYSSYSGDSADSANSGAAGRALDLPPEVERLRWAEALDALSDPLGALVLLEPLLAEHGQDPNIRRVAASAYFASAQLGRARKVLEATLDDHPADSYARSDADPAGARRRGRETPAAGRGDDAGIRIGRISLQRRPGKPGTSRFAARGAGLLAASWRAYGGTRQSRHEALGASVTGVADLSTRGSVGNNRPASRQGASRARFPDRRPRPQPTRSCRDQRRPGGDGRHQR
ncbi:tetratricopeptide repeat protein [Catenulispora pinisilvae]|uniref:tetratricopeptide repeat protein n=1 Tax=Catenulispora pinisilvae TaxID=2705253 RepID=UPI0022654B28|nr:tetratricopeptide repeat protein [Catenulispora pinisilvae]